MDGGVFSGAGGALRLSSALKLTLRAMMLAPFSQCVAMVSANA